LKGLILAGGKGTRLRPLTYSISKQLIPIANKPVVEYGIEALVKAGITNIGIIISEYDSPIIASCGDGERWGCTFTYIVQDQPLGLAHAVKTARPFLGGDPFVMYLGDNLINADISPVIEEFKAKRPGATILLKQVPNPSQFGVAEIEGDAVVRLEEKPLNPKSDLALVGIYVFSSLIHAIIDNLTPSKRGEYEITEAIQKLLDHEYTVLHHTINEAWWKDTGSSEALIEANAVCLSSISEDLAGEIYDSVVTDHVILHKTAKVINSLIEGPAIIGENTVIANSYVGAFTSIGNNVFIENTHIENSIVMDGSSLYSIKACRNSLIGRNVYLEEEPKNEDQAKQFKVFVLGDDSNVSL